MFMNIYCMFSFNQVDDLFDNITTVTEERKKETFEHRTKRQI